MQPTNNEEVIKKVEQAASLLARNRKVSLDSQQKRDRRMLEAENLLIEALELLDGGTGSDGTLPR